MEDRPTSSEVITARTVTPQSADDMCGIPERKDTNISVAGFERDPGSPTIPDPQSKTRCFGGTKASQMSVLKQKSIHAPNREHQKLCATCPASDDLAYKGNALMPRMQ